MKLLSLIASLFLHCLHLVIRVRHVGVKHVDQTPQYILAFWHDHLLLMLHARYRRPIMGLISKSKDGEIIARVMELYGTEAARGSSTRGGGAALRELIRAAREGKNLAFTPDGPKGPRRIAKDGVVYAARATGLPVVPVAFAAKKKSICDRGTGWSYRCRSRVRSSSTASQSRFRGMETSSSGACVSSRTSTGSPKKQKTISTISGRSMQGSDRLLRRLHVAGVTTAYG
jgi:lysophospholipid acyltransferase (LPLAT)-like uncharacterized protein